MLKGRFHCFDSTDHTDPTGPTVSTGPTNDFVALPAHQMSSTPLKSMVYTFDIGFIKKRAEALQVYLNVILAPVQAADHPMIVEFLRDGTADADVASGAADAVVAKRAAKAGLGAATKGASSPTRRSSRTSTTPKERKPDLSPVRTATSSSLGTGSTTSSRASGAGSAPYSSTSSTSVTAMSASAQQRTLFARSPQPKPVEKSSSRPKRAPPSVRNVSPSSPRMQYHAA